VATLMLFLVILAWLLVLMGVVRWAAMCFMFYTRRAEPGDIPPNWRDAAFVLAVIFLVAKTLA